MIDTMADKYIGRFAVYLKPEIFLLAQRTAEAENLTMSAWIRKLVAKELVRTGRMTAEQLAALS